MYSRGWHEQGERALQGLSRGGEAMQARITIGGALLRFSGAGLRVIDAPPRLA
jgi:hypothetical protein